MTSSVSGSFVIPDGFAEERLEGQLYHEDLEEDDEIWLIRMPSDVELSSVDKKKILLSNQPDKAALKNIKTGDGKILECYAENCEVKNLCVLLPQRSDDKLRAVKKAIKGSILISEGLAFDEDVQVKSENVNDDGQSENVHASDAEPSRVQKEKKKKNKKRHSTQDFDSSDLNYETEDADAVSSALQNIQGKKHSGSHKKSGSGRVKVKNESSAMDWDEFPPCASQK